MTKLEILKLQADVYMNPFLMWRIEVEKDIIKYPMELIQMESIWEWNEDVEHDAICASVAQSDRIDGLTTEIVDCLLLKTDQYDDISDKEYNELSWYVFEKVEEEIMEEVFDDRVFESFRQWFEGMNETINNLITE